MLALTATAVLVFSAAQLAEGRSPDAAHKAATVPLGGINLPGLGIGSTPADADQEIAAAVALHANVVRAELPWALLEPLGRGQLDPRALAYMDRLFADAAQHGIAVIALVDATPCWASSAPARLIRACVPRKNSAANSWPPTRPEDFGALAGALAARYRDKLTALEVWNEPDQANELYFAGPHKAERYAAILKAGYTAVKSVDSNIKVLAGSLVGANGVFLKLLYAAGIKGFYDGLAIHFYTLTLGSIRAFREVQTANGDSTPLWLDEFGWPSCWPHERVDQQQACVTPAVQAANITNIFRSLSRTSYIAAETLYKLRDAPANQFGVLTTRGTRKPSYAALSRVLVSPLGSPSPVTLRLGKSRGRLIARGSAPVGDFMQLEVFRGPLLRYRALFVLDRFNRYSITLPSVLGTRGLRVRVFQYWAGVGQAAQRSV